MKTCCSSWSYHRVIAAKKMTLMSFIEECARLELDGVELLGRHFESRNPAYLRDVKKLCADRYLTIAMVSAGGHLTTQDDAQRAADVKEIGEWMDTALYLGAPLIRFFCGNGPELTAGGPALYAKVLAAMKQVAEIAQKKGVVAALENHGNTSADQVLALLRDVGSPWIKFTLDTGNFPPTSRLGPETYKSIERCAPHAAIVHAKFFNVKPDGRDADFDWDKIHDILRKAGFNGSLSVEYEGDDSDEVAVMKRIAPYLKKLR